MLVNIYIYIRSFTIISNKYSILLCIKMKFFLGIIHKHYKNNNHFYIMKTNKIKDF